MSKLVAEMVVACDSASQLRCFSFVHVMVIAWQSLSFDFKIISNKGEENNLGCLNGVAIFSFNKWPRLYGKKLLAIINKLERRSKVSLMILRG